MCILLLILVILATIVCLVCAYKNDMAFGAIGAVIGAILAMSLIVSMIHCTNRVISYKYIDKKIEMYEEENTEIEQQIDAIVENYMKYESDTFSASHLEGSIALISLYPELKSDTLVQSQITIYANNNQKIKELKEQKIDTAQSRWWLYFGE